MADDSGSSATGQGPAFHTVIELAARWYVFVFLNVYGLGKIAGGQFYRRGRLPEEVANTLLGEADRFDLAWTFMGYSFAYVLLIGLAEATPGLVAARSTGWNHRGPRSMVDRLAGPPNRADRAAREADENNRLG